MTRRAERRRWNDITLKLEIKYYYRGDGLDKSIHKIEIKRRLFSKKVYEIIIFSSRAGLLIGKKGVIIFELTNILSNKIGHKIAVLLEDYDPFSD